MPVVEVRDVNLYYEAHGHGPPVVLSHGVLDDCSLWETQIDGLSRSHTVVLYDHRGHGRSDKPRGDYSIQTLADDLKGLMERLGIERASLVGYSLGGMTSLKLALDHPESVHKLVLVATPARAFPQSPAMAGLVNYLSPLVPYRFVARKAMRRGSGPEKLDPGVPKHVALAFTLSLLTSYDLRAAAHRVKVPTLIVSGEKDLGVPVKMSRFLHRAIRGSLLAIIPDCGHLLVTERPAEFNRVLTAFLDGDPVARPQRRPAGREPPPGGPPGSRTAQRARDAAPQGSVPGRGPRSPARENGGG